MARNVYSVMPAGKTWQVRDGTTGREFPRKEEAVRWGREQAKKAMPSQLRVHGQNGRIQHEYTYGSDPRDSKG
jgi:hypothetical protein